MEEEKSLCRHRFYHLSLSYKNYLVIYGGQSSSSGAAARNVRPVHCDIFMFDLTTHQWHDVKVKDLNRVNTSRRNHCGALLGDWMIVYGGLNTCVQYLDDLQAFNFITLTWTHITPVGSLRPPALCRSAARTVFHKQRRD